MLMGLNFFISSCQNADLLNATMTARAVDAQQPIDESVDVLKLLIRQMTETQGIRVSTSMISQ